MRRAFVLFAFLTVACGSTVQVGAPGTVEVGESAAPAADQGLAYEPPGASEGTEPGAAGAGQAAGGTGMSSQTSSGTTSDSPAGSSGRTIGNSSSASGGSGQGGSQTAADGGGSSAAAQPDAAPLRIGIIVPEGNAAGAFGGALEFEDYEQIAEALVADLNDNGGIGGRTVEPVIRQASQDDQSREAQTRQAEEICASLTEDTTVDVVVADGTTGTFYALDCYARHRTPVLAASSVSTDARIRDLRPWVLPYPMHTSERVARELPRMLASSGALTQKIGLLAFNIPEYRRIVEEVFKPAIAQHGGKVLETRYMEVSYQDVSAQVSAAVLSFKAKGIDLVLPSYASGGAVPAIFMHEAESQGYRPNYGLSSFDAPVVMDETLGAPPAQMANSIGLGFSPARDVPQGEFPPLPREQACWDVVNERLGTSYNSRSPTDGNGYAAIQMCELLWLVDAALDPTAGQPVERGAIIEHVEALGTSHEPVQMPSSRFASGRPDGAAVQRAFGFDADGCSCFTYTGDWTPVG